MESENKSARNSLFLFSAFTCLFLGSASVIGQKQVFLFNFSIILSIISAIVVLRSIVDLCYNNIYYPMTYQEKLSAFETNPCLETADDLYHFAEGNGRYQILLLIANGLKHSNCPNCKYCRWVNGETIEEFVTEIEIIDGREYV